MERTGKTETEFAYGDILGASRPASGRRPSMPRIDRAAQFAPFAALSGYGDAVRDCAREHGAEETSMESP